MRAFGSFARRIWTGWLGIATYVGDFQARVLLGIFSAVVAPPFAVVTRLRDTLQIGTPPLRTAWIDRASRPDSLDQSRRQF